MPAKPGPPLEPHFVKPFDSGIEDGVDACLVSERHVPPPEVSSPKFHELYARVAYDAGIGVIVMEPQPSSVALVEARKKRFRVQILRIRVFGIEQPWHEDSKLAESVFHGSTRGRLRSRQPRQFGPQHGARRGREKRFGVSRERWQPTRDGVPDEDPQM